MNINGSGEARLLNYLLNELRDAGIEYVFCDAFDPDYRVSLHWVSNTDEIDLVAGIVYHAEQRKATIAISYVSNYDEKFAIFMGYV